MTKHRITPEGPTERRTIALTAPEYIWLSKRGDGSWIANDADDKAREALQARKQDTLHSFD